MNSFVEPRPFRYHAPSFRGVLLGYARCRVCGTLFTDKEFVEESCSGIQVAVEAPKTAGSVPCALCGVPVAVEAEHRATVEYFGTSCDSCAEVVAL